MIMREIGDCALRKTKPILACRAGLECTRKGCGEGASALGRQGKARACPREGGGWPRHENALRRHYKRGQTVRNKANFERARLLRRYAPRNDGRRHATGRGRVRPNIVAALPLVMSSGAKRSRDIWHQKWRTFWSRPDPSTTLGVTERVCSATACWLNGGGGWGQNLLGFWGQVV
jgi:hypothetical protein